MTATSQVSRRDFLRTGAAVGAGLTVAVQIACAPRGDEKAASGPAGPPFAPNAFVRVATDGEVTVICGYSEMGQGALTAIPMLVAEELDVEWSRVRVEQSPAAEAYFNPLFGIQGTGGSSTVRGAWKPLREAGARARAMLVSAAAAQWSVAPAECRTESGQVLHEKSGRKASYGALVEAASKLTPPEQVTLKDPKDFKVLGKAVPRLDLGAKVTGKAGFGMDVRVPGMLVAVVARCPVFGGKAGNWNAATAKAVPGVKDVVAITSGVAVVADSYWAARKGRDAMKVEWDVGANAGQSSAKISTALAGLLKRPGISTRKEGKGAAPQGGKTIEAVYEVPYIAHACMEPMNATAHVEADKVTVWAPVQFQAGGGFGGGARELAARIAGVPVAKAIINTTFLGGGFGRRFFLDFVADAVECSKLMAAPVKVVWSREEDIQHDWYRPVSTVGFRATLAPDGSPVSFVARVACAPIMPPAPGKVDDSSVEGLSNLPYAIPNIAVEAHNPALGVPTGFWRSVGSSQNAFFLECFIDEMAAAAGKDPFEFRRGLLDKAPRHKRVLELAAEKAGWGTPLPAGHARGIAVAESFASFVAEVAEVSLEDGVPRVHRVVAAIDCGPIANPDIIAAQIESAIVYGLTAALYGEIDIEGGQAVQANFDTYRMLRINQMPVVEVHIVPSTDAQGGVGEPGTPPIAPAVVNALAALTGKRIRRLPLVPAKKA